MKIFKIIKNKLKNTKFQVCSLKSSIINTISVFILLLIFITFITIGNKFFFTITNYLI